MSDRITDKMLQRQIAALNELTGNAPAPYHRSEDGTFRANVGNYHLDQSYGGVNLLQMATDGGGVTCPLGQGTRPKRELYGQLEAMLTGIKLAKGAA